MTKQVPIVQQLRELNLNAAAVFSSHEMWVSGI